jgi:hypothetical protein
MDGLGDADPPAHPAGDVVTVPGASRPGEALAEALTMTATLAAAGTAAFVEEIKARERSFIRSVWLDTASTVLTPTRGAHLISLDRATMSQRLAPTSVFSPIVSRGFHPSSAVSDREVQWQWQRADGCYEAFTATASRKLEARFRAGKAFAELLRDGARSDVIFGTLTQVDMEGAHVGRSRKVRPLVSRRDQNPGEIMKSDVTVCGIRSGASLLEAVLGTRGSSSTSRWC